jgi:hypothetical protein
MSEKITQVAVGLGLIVGGAVLLIPAIVILLQAAVSALIKSHVFHQIIGSEASAVQFVETFLRKLR